MWLSCTVRVWDGVKRAYKIDGFIEPITRHVGKKDTLRFLNIICHDEVDPQSTYDSI